MVGQLPGYLHYARGLGSLRNDLLSGPGVVMNEPFARYELSVQSNLLRHSDFGCSNVAAIDGKLNGGTNLCYGRV